MLNFSSARASRDRQLAHHTAKFDRYLGRSSVISMSKSLLTVRLLATVCYAAVDSVHGTRVLIYNNALVLKSLNIK